jgi:hypothetical protein
MTGGLKLMRAGLQGLRNARHQVFYSVFLGNLAKWIASGDQAEALSLIGEAVERAEQSDEGWYLPELLRLHGELQLAADPSDALAANSGSSARLISSVLRKRCHGNCGIDEPGPTLSTTVALG